MAIIAHLAKPGQPSAVTRKLIDWQRIRSGLPAQNRRSRASIADGMSTVRRGLLKASKAGEAFDQYCAFILSRSHPDRMPHLDGFSQPVSAVFGQKDDGSNWDTSWNPWRPVVHVAASFRWWLFKTGRGQVLHSNDRWLDLAEILLNQSADWVPKVLEHAEARLGVAAQAGAQFPKSTIFFSLAD